MERAIAHANREIAQRLDELGACAVDDVDHKRRVILPHARVVGAYGRGELEERVDRRPVDALAALIRAANCRRTAVSRNVEAESQQIAGAHGSIAKVGVLAARRDEHRRLGAPNGVAEHRRAACERR